MRSPKKKPPTPQLDLFGQPAPPPAATAGLKLNLPEGWNGRNEPDDFPEPGPPALLAEPGDAIAKAADRVLDVSDLPPVRLEPGFQTGSNRTPGAAEKPGWELEPGFQTEDRYAVEVAEYEGPAGAAKYTILEAARRAKRDGLRLRRSLWGAYVEKGRWVEGPDGVCPLTCLFLGLKVGGFAAHTGNASPTLAAAMALGVQGDRVQAFVAGFDRGFTKERWTSDSALNAWLVRGAEVAAELSAAGLLV